MIRKIHLHGSASELGDCIELDADSLPMLFAGLNSAFKGFRKLVSNSEQFALVYKNADGTYESLSEDALAMPFGENEELHFITRAKGADPATAAAAAAYFFEAGTVAYYVAAAAIYIAMVIAVSYVAASLAPSPEVGGSESAENEPSFMFNGAVNITEEGYAVPLVYGRVLTGSVVISVGTEVENISLVQ